jgi:KaiC/GvpD/RAD55 family RecA-like ATPase
MNDIISYISGKNVEYKLVGDEILITCPHCNKQKLSINSKTGVFKCWVCEAENPNSPYVKGHIGQLQEMWGDVIPLTTVSDKIDPNKNQQEVNYTDLVERYHFTLMSKEGKKGFRYLLKRGITEESIKKFKLGFTRRFSQDWLVIPSFEDGIPKLLKLRKLEPNENEKMAKYIREEGSKSILFNGDVLKEHKVVLVTEGEIDAITLIQHGFENTIGGQGAGTLLPEWYDSLAVLDRLFLVFDGDKAGQNAARDVWATRLGESRCWNVELPEGYDANMYFQKGGRKEDFIKLLENAYQFKVSGVVSLKEALQEMYRYAQDEKNIQKYKLPWDNVNYLIGGGLARKRLTVLGGIPGVGKTSLALQICYSFAKRYKIPSLFFCMEMPETSLATKIVQLEYDLTIDEINPMDGLVYADGLGELPLYFGYSSKVTPEIFYNTMKEARNRYGVQLGVFDNLQRMVRTGEEKDIGAASGVMNEIVMDLNMMLILISQPRKMNREDNPTYDDLKGSSAIPADADEVILLHRKRTGEGGALEPKTRVIVDKSRFAPGGRAFLEMEGAKSKFVAVKKEEYDG